MWSEIASLFGLKIFLEPPWIHRFIIIFPAQTCHELRTTSHFHPQHPSNHLSAGPSELLLARLFSALPQLWLWPRCRRQDGQVLDLNEGHIPTFGVQNHTSSACRDPKLTSNLVWSASSARSSLKYRGDVYPCPLRNLVADLGRSLLLTCHAKFGAAVSLWDTWSTNVGFDAIWNIIKIPLDIERTFNCSHLPPSSNRSGQTLLHLTLLPVSLDGLLFVPGQLEITVVPSDFPRRERKAVVQPTMHLSIP